MLRFGERSRRDWWAIFWLLTLVGVVFSFTVHAEELARDSSLTAYGKAVLLELTGVWSTFVLLPILIPLFERCLFQRDNWALRLLQHAAIFLIYGLCQTSLMVGARTGAFALIGWDYNRMPLGATYLYEYHKQLLAYIMILGLVHFAAAYHRERERERERAALELKASQLSTQLARAQLRSLEMQIHPHFLFNALNAVSSLVYTDPAGADKMIADLSRLLRLALDNVDKQKIPLSEELSFLRLYMEVMKGRYQEELKVDFRIEPGFGECMVPHLVMQPLVENAIKHMDLEAASPALVAIHVHAEDRRLILEVLDNGPGLESDEASCLKKGLGLSNLRARLENLYGEQAVLRLENRDEGGLRAGIVLPLERSGEIEEVAHETYPRCDRGRRTARSG
jgi:signal transduction histidine kinase